MAGETPEPTTPDPAPRPTALSPMRYPVFRRVWLASASSIFGGMIQSVGAAWLMTSIAQSADMVSKYLIERAEQYQPVIEMPTGINVEIVFLEGVFIQN